MGAERESRQQRAGGWSQLFYARNTKSLMCPYLLTVGLGKTTCQAMSQKGGHLLRALGRQGHKDDRNITTSCPGSLESPRSRGATAQHYKLLRSFLLWRRRNWGRAWLSPSITINLRSLKSLQKCVYIGTQILEFNRIRMLLLRQGGACWDFQNFSSAQENNFIIADHSQIC